MTGQNEKAEERIRERTAAWRRDFHAHPELSGEERETARRIRLALNEMGIPYRCPGDYYAVIGDPLYKLLLPKNSPGIFIERPHRAQSGRLYPPTEKTLDELIEELKATL